jgi:hypothetical protein
MALTWPTLTRYPTRVDWALRSLTQVHESPLNGSVQSLELPGSRWMASIVYENVRDESDKAALRAFALQMRGRAGRVNVPVFQQITPRGTLGGTPLVAGASQTGATLNTDGWTVGATLLAGDFFKVGGELKMSTANGTANGSGVMSVTFEPILRASPADNAALTFTGLSVEMMAVADDFGWTYQAGSVLSFVFDLIEVI